MTQQRLLIVIASTRPGRVGLPVADWFRHHADRHAGFAIEVADLAEVDLPLLDEPNHPREQKYTKAHTLAWSETVAAADAFVLVHPEYNFGVTAPLKNALDYLSREWKYKPVGLVSYGGVSAGQRAANMLREISTALGMMPIPESVAIPFVRNFLDEDGAIQPNELMSGGATAMLDELVRWSTALATLRA